MISVVEESNPFTIRRLPTKWLDWALYLVLISFGQHIYLEAQLLKSTADCSVAIHKIEQSTSILVLRITDR